MTNRAKERRKIMSVSAVLHELKKEKINGIHFRNVRNGEILRSYQNVYEAEASEFYQKNTPGYLLAYGHAIIDVM